MKSRRLKSKNFRNFQPKFFGGKPKFSKDFSRRKYMKSRRVKSKNFQNFQPKFFGGQPKSLADENK